MGAPVISRSFATVLAEKRQEPEPEHVERGQQGSKNPDRPIDGAPIGTGKYSPKDRVLGDEAGGRGKAPNGKGGHRPRPERPRDVLFQSPHTPHIPPAADGMDHGTGRQEQQ